MDHLEVHVLREGVHHLLRLVQAQQPVVDEDAGELLADGAMDQRRRHRRIDAAREAEDDLLVSDLLLDFFYRLGNIIRHVPVGAATADAVHEALQQLRALARMRDLGMELHAVEAALLIRHRRDRAGVGGSHQLEPRRQLRDLVAVAHPDLEHAVAFRRAQVLDVFQQPGVAARPDFGVAELAHASRLDPAAELLGHGLHPVADAQHRHAQVEHRRRRLAGGFVVGG